MPRIPASQQLIPAYRVASQQTSLPPASSRVSSRRSLPPTDSLGGGRYGTRDSLDAGLAEMAITKGEGGVVKNVDAKDAANELCVPDYIGDIYEHLRATEVSPTPHLQPLPSSFPPRGAPLSVRGRARQLQASVLRLRPGPLTSLAALADQVPRIAGLHACPD